jgi:hypothetical protein
MNQLHLLQDRGLSRFTGSCGTISISPSDSGCCGLLFTDREEAS